MPMISDFDLKMNLNNFLILNSEYKRLSFTYLNNFDYSTDSLIGEHWNNYVQINKPKKSVDHSHSISPHSDRVPGAFDLADADDRAGHLGGTDRIEHIQPLITSIHDYH